MKELGSWEISDDALLPREVRYIEVLYRYVVHIALRREVRSDFKIHGTKYF